MLFDENLDEGKPDFKSFHADSFVFKQLHIVIPKIGERMPHTRQNFSVWRVNKFTSSAVKIQIYTLHADSKDSYYCCILICYKASVYSIYGMLLKLFAQLCARHEEL